MRRRSALALLLVAAPAIAKPAAPPPPPPAPPANAAALSGDDLAREILRRSPAGQHEAGVRRSGVYDLRDAKTCSRWSVETILARFRNPPQPTLLAPGDLVLDRDAPKGTLSAPMDLAGLSSTIRRDITIAWDMLRLGGDKLVNGRHVCVGLASYAQANAESSAIGFMLFDPQLYYDLNKYKSRSMRTGMAIVLHEFAHQLQFWTDEPFQKDKLADGESYARRSELQADCVAAALVSVTAVEFKSPRIWPVSRAGVLTAFRELGDFDIWKSGHHGLPNERDLAAEYGVRLVEERAAKSKLYTFAAPWALDQCRQMIERMDKKHGTPWPITAVLE